MNISIVCISAFLSLIYNVNVISISHNDRSTNLVAHTLVKFILDSQIGLKFEIYPLP